MTDTFVFLITKGVTLFCMITIILIYPYLNPYFPNDVINDTFPLLLILFAGLFFYSGFIPFDFVFLQAGKPLTQTSLLFVSVLINICLNFIFIQLYGLYGAALSTSLALILAAINLIILARYKETISK